MMETRVQRTPVIGIEGAAIEISPLNVMMAMNARLTVAILWLAVSTPTHQIQRLAALHVKVTRTATRVTSVCRRFAPQKGPASTPTATSAMTITLVPSTYVIL